MRKLLYFFLLFFAFNITGKINAQIDKDSGWRYSLYLPQKYSKENKYPLIIFLDPAAQGGMAVSNYKVIAEKYDIVMAGSLSSRNFDNTTTKQSVLAIYDDVVTKYAIDTQMVWLAGFSGGARASCSIAIENEYVKGIIACGAGFAGDDVISSVRKIPFASIVGNVDMNYQELFEISEYLDGINNQNIMLTFQGGHEWPPTEYFELAVLWLMRKNIKEKANLPILNFDYYINSLIKKADSSFLFQAYFEAQQLKKIPSFFLIADSIASSIESNMKFAIDKVKYMSIISEERNYMDEFSKLFNEVLQVDELEELKSGQWTPKAKTIKNMQQSDERYQQLSGMRCFDYSIRCCLEYSFEFIAAAEYYKAYNVANIMLFFDSKDNLAYYLMAKAAAGIKNKKLCEKSLKEYSKRGIIREKMILNDPLFGNIFTNEEIKKILGIQN